MRSKILSLNILLYLALVLALVSSLGHVAFAFATTNGGNWLEAYVSAIAIDMGLLALAAGINQRKSQRRAVKTLWAGVILFSVISTYANWLSGVVHVQSLSVTVNGIGSFLVSLRPILLSGVLPTLVIYLSEIVSGNHQAEVTEAQKLAKRSVSQAADDTKPDTLALARDTKAEKADGRRLQVKELLTAGKSQSQIADELGVSVITVKRDAKSLGLNGRGK